MPDKMEGRDLKDELFSKRDRKKGKRIKVIFLLLVTLFFCLIVLGIACIILFGEDIYMKNGQNNGSDVYRFSGEILFSQLIDKYCFVTEYIPTGENVGNLQINFLYENRLASNIVVAENINIERYKEYAIAFKDYNDDGMLDFSHVFKNNDDESIYKIYTLTKEGKLLKFNDEEYRFNSNKFSVALEVKDGEYTYNDVKLYYNGYEIGTDVGTYKLAGNKKTEYTRVNKYSNLSFQDNRTIDIPQYEMENSLSQMFLEKHNMFQKYNDVEVRKIDMDNDGNKEKLVYLFDKDTNDTEVILFDSFDEVVANLINVKGEKYEFNEVVELIDIDNDGTIELITKQPGLDEITISKYHFGYYFPIK